MHAGSPDRIWAKHRKRKGPGAIAEPIFRLARPAWSARSSATGRRHPGKAGKGPLPKLPGRVLYRAAADRRNPTRATIRENSRRSHRASRRSTPAQLRKTDALAAGSAHPGWRRHWCRPSAQVQSWFCACVRIGAWAGVGRHPRQSAAASRNGEYARTDQRAQTAADGLPTAASSVGSEAQSLESEQ